MESAEIKKRCGKQRLYRGWESNPHVLRDTWPSTMPVYQFQHLGKDALKLKSQA